MPTTSGNDREAMGFGGRRDTQICRAWRLAVVHAAQESVAAYTGAQAVSAGQAGQGGTSPRGILEHGAIGNHVGVG